MSPVKAAPAQPYDGCGRYIDLLVDSVLPFCCVRCKSVDLHLHLDGHVSLACNLILF